MYNMENNEPIQTRQQNMAAQYTTLCPYFLECVQIQHHVTHVENNCLNNNNLARTLCSKGIMPKHVKIQASLQKTGDLSCLDSVIQQVLSLAPKGTMIL